MNSGIHSWQMGNTTEKRTLMCRECLEDSWETWDKAEKDSKRGEHAGSPRKVKFEPILGGVYVEEWVGHEVLPELWGPGNPCRL